MKQSLNGVWKLAYRDTIGEDRGEIAANVPGNVELDLIAAGKLPPDLFMADHIERAEKYETYEWTYTTTFDCEDTEKAHRIVFYGVDTVAAYYINGEKLGESKNMLVEHTFALPPLKKTNNELQVVITPICIANKKNVYTQRILQNGLSSESSFIRKAAHTYGWDIMPRAVSAGIWKEVCIETVPDYEFSLLNVTTESIDGDTAFLHIAFAFTSKEPVTRSGGYTVQVRGKCGDSEFFGSCVPKAEAGFLFLSVEDAKLWNVRDRGAANLYDVTATLSKNGQILCAKQMRTGIRTVSLTATDEAFYFTVNGEKIYAMGTNWVPLSPYHSQDKARLPTALDLLERTGSNMVRCWGGNVYENDEFFDYMDEHGILVWQDFSFACNAYSFEDSYFEELREEARKVIARLRNHPSLALWAGDNELDQFCVFSSDYDPSQNRISREILKQAVYEHDRRRAYLPSSPFISEKNYRAKTETTLPERHLWGKRDWFKSDYYLRYTGQFVSEIGYHGCVERDSAERFIPKTDLENRAASSWALHSTDIDYSRHRVKLMEDQILFLFGSIPDTFDDFARASQLSQAEAYKFFIENARYRKEKTGVLWWNLLDGWPQFSDAVVDYYGKEKLAYKNICRSQAQVLCMIAPDENGNFTLWGINDSVGDVCIDIRVEDGDTKEVFFEGRKSLPKGGRVAITTLQFFSKQRLVLLSWQGDAVGKNHFISGYPEYEWKRFSHWYDLINE